MALQILHEDNHLIAVVKAAGTLTQGDHTGAPTLMEEVKESIKLRHRKPGKVFLGLVHRLDRPVSGIIVFARTSKAAARLQRQFQGRTVLKCYLALVSAAVPPQKQWAELHGWLERPGDRSYVRHVPGPGRQEARLRYRCMKSADGQSLLLVRLITGRKHQIRAQLTDAGMPIVGDERYGSPAPFRPGAIALHSCCLGFNHPTTGAPLVLRDLPPMLFGGVFPLTAELTDAIDRLLDDECRSAFPEPHRPELPSDAE